jgi:hypothetical protein
MRVSKTVLAQLERILESSGYRVRYEKGSFKGGYCVLQDQRVVVVNKFYPLEGRINTLSDVIGQLDSASLSPDLLQPEELKLLNDIRAKLMAV